MCPSLTGTTGPHLGCLVSQPPRLLTPPNPTKALVGGRYRHACVCRPRASGAGRGASRVTMGWCLALLVLRGAFLPYGGVHLVSLPCFGTLRRGGGEGVQVGARG